MRPPYAVERGMGIEPHPPNNQPRGGRADDRLVLSCIVPPIVIPPALGISSSQLRLGRVLGTFRSGGFANNPPEKAVACKRRLVVQLY
jgi:hypothetical protein